jgi:hypothetical protein
MFARVAHFATVAKVVVAHHLLGARGDARHTGVQSSHGQNFRVPRPFRFSFLQRVRVLTSHLQTTPHLAPYIPTCSSSIFVAATQMLTGFKSLNLAKRSASVNCDYFWQVWRRAVEGRPSRRGPRDDLAWASRRSLTPLAQTHPREPSGSVPGRDFYSRTDDATSIVIPSEAAFWPARWRGAPTRDLSSSF